MALALQLSSTTALMCNTASAWRASAGVQSVIAVMAAEKAKIGFISSQLCPNVLWSSIG
ncbi:hypothetical protein NCF85_15100 [Qipengyuania citrea]|uniref:Uncharacterized protein n=1 Tax=Qipengyuania citrea TaxID=225971 RepID=A0ABY4UD03_9SPHN|nr:hypothetical protein [Qipengyuania citrea]USA62981.1 hypothetical protein NCF85_15100 [Qipengyuania citrea]